MSSIREQVLENIKPNNNRRITGQIMQDALIGMIDNYEDFAAVQSAYTNAMVAAVSGASEDFATAKAKALSAALQTYIDIVVASTSGKLKTDIDSAMTRISTATAVIDNGDGTYTHIGYIDGSIYQWRTKDLGDYLLIDTEVSGTPGGKTTKFMVSKDGLLTADNAWVKGTIMATDGFFKGSVSADSGYFRGDVVASSLKLGGHGNQTIEDYVGTSVESASGAIGTHVDEAIAAQSAYTNSMGEAISAASKALGVTISGGAKSYADLVAASVSGAAELYATAKANAVSAASKAYAEAVVNNASGALKTYADSISGLVKSAFTEINLTNTKLAAATTVIKNEDGTYTHIGYVNGSAYTWETRDIGDYLIIDTMVSGTTGGQTTKFLVDKNGYLEADNAFIKGIIIAHDGFFQGSVSADSGYFRGDIVASSLKLENHGEQSIEDFVENSIGSFSGSMSGISAKIAAISAYTQAMGDAISGAAKSYAETLASSVSGAAEAYAEAKANAVSAAAKAYASAVVNDASGALKTYLDSISSSTLSALTSIDATNLKLAAATTVIKNADGTYSHIGYLNGSAYTWETRDIGDYLIIDSMVSGTSGGQTTKFMVDKNGLLTADNAWV